jgi:kynurenine formamidase
MITITKFNGMNYAQWATEMALRLKQKQVYGIMKDTTTRRKSQWQTQPLHRKLLSKTG